MTETICANSVYSVETGIVARTDTCSRCPYSNCQHIYRQTYRVGLRFSAEPCWVELDAGSQCEPGTRLA